MKRPIHLGDLGGEYVNRSFTDQVTSGMGGLKQEVGRSEMLADIAANLRRVREQLKKY